MKFIKKIPIWFSIIAIAVAVFVVPVQANNTFNSLVQTQYGKIQGYEKGDAIVWKGVPYAKPPENELRWKAPQDPDSWSGVRDGSSPADKCTQLFTTDEWIRTGGVDKDSSEDCLYVDIYRPKHNARLPVYVWIHGG